MNPLYLIACIVAGSLNQIGIETPEMIPVRPFAWIRVVGGGTFVVDIAIAAEGSLGTGGIFHVGIGFV